MRFTWLVIVVDLDRGWFQVLHWDFLDQLQVVEYRYIIWQLFKERTAT